MCLWIINGTKTKETTATFLELYLVNPSHFNLFEVNLIFLFLKSSHSGHSLSKTSTATPALSFRLQFFFERFSVVKGKMRVSFQNMLPFWALDRLMAFSSRLSLPLTDANLIDFYYFSYLFLSFHTSLLIVFLNSRLHSGFLSNNSSYL